MISNRIIALLFIILTVVTGCGGGSGGGTATLVSLTVLPSDPSIGQGTVEQFVARGNFSDSSNQDLTSSVTWSSSTPSVATISNSAGTKGQVTSLGTGTTTITAQLGGMSAFTTLTVTLLTLTSLAVTPANAVVGAGTAQQFSAIGTYSDKSTKNLTASVTWSSSFASVAAISSSGTATASTAGSTMITAASAGIAGAAVLTVTTTGIGGNDSYASNVLPITVNGSLCSPPNSLNPYLNKPCVSVTICSPGATTCQTINDILLDTGSFGLRIFKSALTAVTLTQVPSGAGSLAECAQFGDGSTLWGPVETAGIVLGSEPAVQVPVQVIDQLFSAPPAACAGPLANLSPTDAGFNGILGVGVFRYDCGSACTSSNIGLYYSCTSTTCNGGTTAPLANQVQNPVALLASDNNGVIVQLPSVSPDGAASAEGNLILGIGTQVNNAPSAGVTAFTTDPLTGEIDTELSGISYSAIIDTGSNGLFFNPPSTSYLPTCSAPNQSWFCPPNLTTLSATNTGATGNPSNTVSFQIGNLNTLINSTDLVFPDIGGPSPDLFVWGMPFCLGETIYVGIQGTVSGLGRGPYFAY